MPWCPNCKNEYVEGIKVCADCQTKLVDSLTEDSKEEALLFGDRKQMEGLTALLEYNGLTGAYIKEDESEHVFEVFVPRKEAEKARKITAVFLQQEAKKESENIVETTDRQQKESAESMAKGVYKDSESKAEDFKSSGYTLIGVGVIGLLGVILFFPGISPFSAVTFFAGREFMLAIMGLLFVLFIGMGISSLRSFRSYHTKAQSESRLKGEILDWCRENLQAAGVDEGLFSETGELDSEEVKYFKRTEKIKGLISDKFLNLDEDFLEQLIDDFYSEIYGGSVS